MNLVLRFFLLYILKRKYIIISGFGPANNGGGQLMKFIHSEFSSKFFFVFLTKKKEDSLLACLKNFDFSLFFLFLKKRIQFHYQNISLKVLIKLPWKKAILFHPQTIGYEKFNLITDEFNQRTNLYLYLLDNAFFCIKSYNTLSNNVCFSCIQGNYDNIHKNNCTPFPVKTSIENAVHFMKTLRQQVTTNKITLLAQNENQAAIAQTHFQLKEPIEVAGMWTEDIDNSTIITEFTKTEYDIIFHGNNYEAKGALWTIKLAALCPEYTFLFPFAKPTNLNITPNCHFKSISWDTGLKEAIIASKITLVPSLWASPIEGALIKSILYSRLTAVVAINSSFITEIPNQIVQKLDIDLHKAKSTISKLIENKIITDLIIKKQWFEHFSLNKSKIITCLNNF